MAQPQEYEERIPSGSPCRWHGYVHIHKLFRRSPFIDAAVWVWNVLSECYQCWKLVWMCVEARRTPRPCSVCGSPRLPTPRALPVRGALWPLAVGVEKDLGGNDVWPCGIVCCSLCGLTHPPSIMNTATMRFFTGPSKKCHRTAIVLELCAQLVWCELFVTSGLEGVAIVPVTSQKLNT